MVKNLPAMRETWVQSLGWEDPLEEGLATHSNILAWRISMDRGAWWAAVLGVTKSRDTEQLSTEQYPFVHMYHIFFIHFSLGGHLGFFHVLAIVNSAAMNIWVHCLFEL